MVEPGDVITAEVTSVQVFGVFCRHESQDMLITIPETSWIASFNSCKQFADHGDHLTVKIVHVDIKSGKISATIKGLYSDPWKTDQLKVGNSCTARVVRYVENSDRCDGNPAYLLELVPGAYVMLRADGLLLEPGQHRMVIIQESNSFNHSVRISIP